MPDRFDVNTEMNLTCELATALAGRQTSVKRALLEYLARKKAHDSDHGPDCYSLSSSPDDRGCHWLRHLTALTRQLITGRLRPRSVLTQRNASPVAAESLTCPAEPRLRRTAMHGIAPTPNSDSSASQAAIVVDDYLAALGLSAPARSCCASTDRPSPTPGCTFSTAGTLTGGGRASVWW